MKELKITKIEAISYRLPVRREFRWAGLQDSVGGFVCVRIETNQGIVGFGEATPLPDWGGDYGRRSGETLNTVKDIVINVIKPLLIDKDPTDIAHIHQLMETYVNGNSYAKCAVDIALYDILGKYVGLPVYKLLGGKVRDEVPVGHMIGIMSLEEAREEARGAYEDGIRAFQIKSGEDYDRDIEVVKMLRKEFGDDVWLRLDANKGYKNVKTTLNILNQMTENGVSMLDMLEQPVEGFTDMAIVTDKLPIKTIMDEGCWNVADAFEAIQRRSTDAFSIYLAKAGGIYQASKVAMLAETFNIPCDVNGSLESAIGTAANIHFALAHPAVSLPCVISINAPEGKHHYQYGGHFYEDDICTEAFPVRNGALLPLDKPGLGIEIDMEKLEKYRV
jgi:muconate cycloisomerase